MRRTLTALAALALLAGCGSARGRAPVVLGALYPLSGSQGAGGTEEARGARLAVEWANGHGGVRGRGVELVAVDAPRAEAVPAALAALRGRHVSVVLGSHGSVVSAEAAREATDQGLVFWETGAVGETDAAVAGGSRFFRMAPMGANLGQAAIAFVRDQVVPRLNRAGPLRYAVAYVDDVYGHAVGSGALRELGAGNQAVVGSFPYDAHASDLGPLAARIAASRPDVLFVAAYLDDGVAMRRALIAGHVPLVTSIGTSSSYCMPAFGEMLGSGAVGLFASDKPDAAAVRAGALAPEGRRTLAWARARYVARYHEPMSAPALSGFSNTYALVAHVLPAAGSTDPDAVARAALGVKLPVGTLANGGGMDLAPPGAAQAGDNRNAASVIWEWVAPGQRAVVWPPAFATHPIAVLPLS
jgi:branched-chain amino acid transport system substrate-binding protein